MLQATTPGIMQNTFHNAILFIYNMKIITLGIITDQTEQSNHTNTITKAT